MLRTAPTIIIIMGLLLSSFESFGKALTLTQQEQEYLAAKGVLKMCVDPNWMPYERITASGVHEGLSADYVALFKRKANINIELVPTENWLQTLEFVKTRRCDFIPLAKKNESRGKFLNFTQPYVFYPTVLATTLDKPYIEGIDQHLDKTFAVVKGFAMIEFLTETYPGIKLKQFNDIAEGLEAVNQNKAFAYIDSLLAISYAIQKNEYLNIKIAGETGYQSAPSIATRNDEPLLNSIFEKIIDSISEQEKMAIYQRWIYIRFEKGENYDLLIKFSIIASAVLLAFLYWNRQLSKAHSQIKQTLTQLQAARKQLEVQNHQLETLAVTDKLTGLYNRSCIEAEANSRILQLSSSASSSFALILLDVDHFKLVNDNYGHQTGDKVLVEFAKLLSSAARDSDLVARWGGEEFLILTHHRDNEQLEKFVARIRDKVNQFLFTEIKQSTVSIGATLYLKGDTLDSMINRADRALYWVKQHGRNNYKIK